MLYLHSKSNLYYRGKPLTRKLTTSIILLLLLSTVTQARVGWNIQNLSFLYGPSFNPYSTLNSFELQLDQSLMVCHMNFSKLKGYRAISINFSSSNNQIEYGVKGAINPTRSVLHISRGILFVPYIFAQTNYITNNSTHTNYWNIRPGIGLTGIIKWNNSFDLRPQIQVGYTINEYHEKVNGYTFEFKLGIGLNTLHIKKKKTTDKDTSN